MTEKNKRMCVYGGKKVKKSIVSLLVSVVLAFSCVVCFAEENMPAQPETESPSVIMIEQNTGRVLYSKNADEKVYPASTTKILTALVALEKGNLDDVITVKASTVNSIDSGSSTMGLLAGEQLTFKDLVYSMMIYSANDAAAVIADYIAGSIEGFAQMMNTRAKELGATNSNFVNPHGLHDDNHYTTARDMAVIARYAMTNPVFADIVKTPMYRMPPTNKYTTERIMPTTNHLISRYRNSNYFYNGATGIKTGYTEKAKNCLVASATKNNTSVITAVMNVTNAGTKSLYSFSDTISLFNYAFDNFAYSTIAKAGDIVSEVNVKYAKGKDYTILTTGDDVFALLPKNYKKEDITTQVTINEKIKAPVAKGEKLGTITYSYNDEVIASCDLVSQNDVKKSILSLIGSGVKAVVCSWWFIIIVLLIAGIYIYLLILRRINRRRRRSKLRMEQKRHMENINIRRF